MLFLKDLVEVSKRVRVTTHKKEKTFRLAECLKRGRGQEISLAASYLSAQIRQGSLGIGWSKPPLSRRTGTEVCPGEALPAR